MDQLRERFRGEFIPIFQEVADKYGPHGIDIYLDVEQFLAGGNELIIDMTFERVGVRHRFALEFLEAGNSVQDIDRAFMAFGMPVGPIRLIDEVGIDIAYNVVRGKNLDQDTLKNVVGAGRLGLKKSGKGFFLQDGSVDPEVLPLIALKEKRALVRGNGVSVQELIDAVTSLGFEARS